MKNKKIFLKFFLFILVFGLGFFTFTGGAQAANPKCSDGIDNVPTDGSCDHADSTYRDNTDGDNLYSSSCAALPVDTDCVSDFDQSEDSGHPFLLVTEDMYEGMRARSNQSPWKEMKAEAITNCLNSDGKSSYDSSYKAHIYYGKSAPLSRIINGCALSYILETDSTKRDNYFNKYKQGMENWIDLKEEIKEHTHTEINSQGQEVILKHGCPQGNSGYCVETGSVFVISIIATDIFYNKLAPADRMRYEGYFGEVSNRFKWPHNDIGTQLVWSIYKKNNQEITKKNLYLDTYFKDKYYLASAGYSTKYVSDDGAYAAGVRYGFHRNIGDSNRAGKFGPMDIATFTGFHNFYADQRFKKLFEWVFHFTLTPNKGNYSTTYGDTNLVEKFTSSLPKSARLYTLNRWSDGLAENAAWLIEGSGMIPDGETSIFAYINDKPLPMPIKPTSKIFRDGGAGFWENNPSSNSLMGAIMSTTITEGHSRNEANSIYIQGYGEHLITNMGATTYDDTIGCLTPDGVGHKMTPGRYNSFNANTVSINLVKHQKKPGYGWSDNGKEISEGFVNTYLDYASADSGSALPNGHHQRNFMFIHPEAGKNNGYFVLFDEISAADSPVNTTAQVYLHTLTAPTPNTNPLNVGPASPIIEVVPYQEYRATTTSIPSLVTTNEAQATISVFLGTPPITDGNTIKRDGNGVVYVGSKYANTNALCRYVDYIRSSYSLDINGNTRKKNIVTILFPSDNTHPKAPMSRITGTNYSGAEIAHSATVKDYALESSSANSVNYNGVTFQGLASMYRINNNENEFYFVRQGKEFNDGKIDKKGFVSNNPVSVYVKDKIGKIIVPAGGATVTFSYPGIAGVKIDGVTKSATTTIPGTDQPKEYAVEILAGPVLNPTDVNQDTRVNIKDIQEVIRCIIDINSCAFQGRSNVNGDGRVNIKDIQAIIRAIIG